MANNYEFFKKPVVITGRHARMAKELWTLSPGTAREERKAGAEDQTREKTFFSRLVDLYKLAPIIGCLEERKGKRDFSGEDTARVFAEQMNREKEELDNTMTMIMMVELADSGLYTKEEAVRLTFKGPASDEEYKKWEDTFHSYVLGGIEVLYEELILKSSAYENEYSNHRNTAAIMEFLGHYGMGRKS